MQPQTRYKLFTLLFSLFFGVSIVGFADITNYGLSLTVSLSANQIQERMPVAVTITLANTSAVPMEVLPIKFGSIDVTDASQASLELLVDADEKGQFRTHYLKPFFGPVKEIYGIPAPRLIRLEPGQLMKQELYIGGRWSWNVEDADSLFREIGRHKLRLIYCPFLASKDGTWNVDRKRYVESNETKIDVVAMSDQDLACWQDIRKLKRWWILYDPEMRNAEYIPEAERRALVDDLKTLAARHSKSAFRKYLEYASASLRLKADKHEATDVDALAMIDRLASDETFAYKVLAKQTKDQLKKK